MNQVEGSIQQGHQVASGLNGNPAYPGGTIRMQLPFFKERGLDLSPFYPGTLNVSVKPQVFEPAKPAHAFKALKWCEDPAEDFAFFTCRLTHKRQIYDGWIYWPAPETKPKHEQDVHIVELLMPQVADLAYGDGVTVTIKLSEGRFV